MDDLEYTCCPVCDSGKYRRFIKSKDFLFSRKEFIITKCESCGALFTNPRVKKNRISQYYFPEYFRHICTEQFENLKKARFICSGFFGNHYTRLLQTLRSIKAKKVLEIGPGNGDLLFFLKNRGFEVTGIEIDNNCVNHIRGKNITCYLGDLEENAPELGNEKFDAIIMCQVFEHLYGPNKALKIICNLLREKGIIYLTVPDSGSLEAKLFGKYWRGFDLPRHIVHYDSMAITAVLEKNNLKVCKIEAQDFPSSFIESIAFFFLKKGRMPKELYYPFYYLWKFFSPIHSRLAGTGVMRIIAAKKHN